MVATQPFFGPQKKRQIRAPINEMDKSTIVSIYPKIVHEIKHTIFPGEFIIPPGTYDKPSLLVVGSSSWWQEMQEGQPDIEVPQSSVVVANAIINDWAAPVMGASIPDAMPGLFFVHGELTLADVKTKHKDALDRAKVRQTNWFQKLIEMADVLWANSNGNPRSISDDMKLAAHELGIVAKGWLANVTAFKMKNCSFCGFLTNHEFPICQNCKNVINPEKAKELGLKVG